MNNEKQTVEDMPEKKRFGYWIHIGIALVMVIVVVIAVIRLNDWNNRSVTVEISATPGEYRSENLDYIIYRTPDQPVREPDGVTRAVVLGNYMVNNYRGEKSILNKLKAGLDWEFIDLSIDATVIARSKPLGEPQELYDEFCLYKMVEYLVSDNVSSGQENPPFYGDVDKEAFVKLWRETDLNKVDYVIIMYSLMDYYYMIPSQPKDGKNEYDTTFGSLLQSIVLLQGRYPHLQIVLASGYPEYINKDGGVEYAYSTDYGNGTMSAYAQIEAAVAGSTNVTYIDNFYCGIDEDNITTYVNEMNLTDAGIDLIGDHVLSVLKKLQD